MGTTWKNIGKALGGFTIVVAFFIAIFIFGLIGLGYYKFFGTKTENVRREIFEQTQSYTHGKTQDLAKYYEEYDKANMTDRESIRQLILIQFADFDESKIRSPELKRFLISMRGY